MAGHSRPKDGVAHSAYVPAIQDFDRLTTQGVDARDERGHDEIFRCLYYKPRAMITFMISFEPA
jgi:hypothetical protein